MIDPKRKERYVAGGLIQSVRSMQWVILIQSVRRVRSGWIGPKRKKKYAVGDTDPKRVKKYAVGEIDPKRK